MKRALIFDLDNTIYPVSSIAENLFEKLFAMMDETNNGLDPDIVPAVKDDLKRRHFHLVANKFNFGPELTQKGIDLLKNMAYELPMQPFEQYHSLKTLPYDKFLVTTGFTKLQWSKVKMLDIEQDFLEIHIVDPEVSQRTKKDVFADIMERHGYTIAEVLVLGDDPESEIKAANDLGIDTFLFDPFDKHLDAVVTFRDKDLRGVIGVMS